MSENGKVVRQYHLSKSIVKKLDEFVVDNKTQDGKSKSEVVEMSIKEYLKNRGVQVMLVMMVLLVLMSDACFAADLGNETVLKDKILSIIKVVCGIAGPVILALGLLIGGIKYYNGDEEAFTYIKGGIIGSLIAGAAWSIATWQVFN